MLPHLNSHKTFRVSSLLSLISWKTSFPSTPSLMAVKLLKYKMQKTEMLSPRQAPPSLNSNKCCCCYSHLSPFWVVRTVLTAIAWERVCYQTKKCFSSSEQTGAHSTALLRPYMSACRLSHCWHALLSWMYCSTSDSMVRFRRSSSLVFFRWSYVLAPVGNRYHNLVCSLGQSVQTVVVLLWGIREKLFSSSGPDSAILPHDNYLAWEGIGFHSLPLPTINFRPKPNKRGCHDPKPGILFVERQQPYVQAAHLW